MIESKEKYYDAIFVLNLPNYYKVNLLNELSKHIKIKVFFICSLSNNRGNDFYFLDKALFDFHVISNLVIQDRSIKDVFKASFVIIKNLLKLRYRSIVVGEWQMLESWMVLLFSFNKKKIFILESSINESNVSGVKAIFKSFFLKLIDVVLPAGKAHLELIERLGYKGVSYISNGVGILNRPNVVKKDYKNRPVNFLFVGRLVKVKNLEFLINVFNEHRELILNIIGTGPEEKHLKSIAKKNIKFIGYIPNKDIGNQFINNDCFVLPSYSETWGLVIEEAIYFGLPILASNKVGAIDHFVIEKQTGEIFEIEDNNDFFKKINLIIENYKTYVANVKKVNFNVEVQNHVNAYLKAIRKNQNKS